MTLAYILRSPFINYPNFFIDTIGFSVCCMVLIDLCSGFIIKSLALWLEWTDLSKLSKCPKLIEFYILLCVECDISLSLRLFDDKLEFKLFIVFELTTFGNFRFIFWWDQLELLDLSQFSFSFIKRWLSVPMFILLEDNECWLSCVFTYGVGDRYVVFVYWMFPILFCLGDPIYALVLSSFLLLILKLSFLILLCFYSNPK